MPTIAFPIVQLNGTPARELSDSYSDVRATVRSLLCAMEDAQPNGRDYYPLDDGALREAIAGYRQCAEALRAVETELLWLSAPEIFSKGEESPLNASSGSVPDRPLRLPVVHTNGTSADELVRCARAVYLASENAVEAFNRIVPNGRDFDPVELEVARNQHMVRVNVVRRVGAYFLQLAQGVRKQTSGLRPAAAGA